MAFQTSANINLALGKPGTISRDNPVVKLPYVAEGSAVKSGGFVFAGTNPELQVVGADVNATSVVGLAVVERYQAPMSGMNNSLIVNEGEEIAVLKRGYAYVVSTTNASLGQSVIVNTTTGAISTDTITYNSVANLTTGEVTTTSSVAAGSLDTGWKVVTGATANNVCEIACI